MTCSGFLRSISSHIFLSDSFHDDTVWLGWGFFPYPVITYHSFCDGNQNPEAHQLPSDGVNLLFINKQSLLFSFLLSSLSICKAKTVSVLGSKYQLDSKSYNKIKDKLEVTLSCIIYVDQRLQKNSPFQNMGWSPSNVISQHGWKAGCWR